MSKYTKIKSLLLLFLLWISAPHPVEAQVYYTGHLLSVDQPVLNGEYTVHFTLYSDEISAQNLNDPIWSESQVLNFADGVFSVGLGEVNSIDEDLFKHDRLTLRFEVDQGPSSPLIPVRRVPSAFYSQSSGHAENCDNALSLEGVNVMELALSTHHHDDRYQLSLNIECNPGEALSSINALGEATCTPLISLDEVTSLHNELPPPDRLIASGSIADTSVYVDSEGRVGVNTLTPDATLDVVGDVKIRGLSGEDQRIVVTSPTGDLSAISQNVLLGSPTDPLNILTTENASEFTIGDQSLVQAKGVIQVSDLSHDPFNQELLSVVGGHFIGSGDDTVRLDLGNRPVFQSVIFEDVYIDDGHDALFINCTFKGFIRMPWDAKIYDSHFTMTTMSGRVYHIAQSEITNSTITRLTRISNSKIRDSQLGGLGTYDRVTYASHNVLDTVKVYLGRGGSFDHNDSEDTYVELGSGSSAFINITDNIFDGLHPNHSKAISIDSEGSSYRAIKLSDNNFFMQPANPLAIEIKGNATGIYQSLMITNNHFMKGVQAISYQGSLTTIVKNNLWRDTSLGVSTGGNILVTSNDDWGN